MTTFIFKLKLKNCDKVFAPGFEPGVLVTQEADFTDCPDEQLAIALFRHESKFLESMVEVEIEEKKQ